MSSIGANARGDGTRSRGRLEAGYAMAVLLVGIAVMSVMLGVAMPVWHQTMQREKEEELIFRGTQYARAINLYQRKFPGAFPPSIDALVEQKMLRKKYKDPMVADGQFQLVPAAATGRAGMVSGIQQVTPQSGTSTGTVVETGRAGRSATSDRSSSNLGTYVGPFSGVVSKSTEKSIKLYNGKDRYNEWLFVYASSLAPGGGRGMRGQGGRGQGGRGQGGRGQDMQMPFGVEGQGRGPGGRGLGPGGGRGVTIDRLQAPGGGRGPR